MKDRSFQETLQLAAAVISQVKGGKQGSRGLMVRPQNSSSFTRSTGPQLHGHRAPIKEGQLGTRQGPGYWMGWGYWEIPYSH